MAFQSRRRPVRCRPFLSRPTRLLSGLVVAVTALLPGPALALASPPSGAAAHFDPAACPTPNVPGFPQLDLGPEFSCGYLTVPEHRSVPDGRTIRMAVARVKAASPNPRPDPILWLTGGPGGSAIATAVLTVQAGLNRDRDIVFVDQRGTLHSDPLLSCPEIDAFLNDALALPALGPATGERSSAATRACRDRLAGQGYDLAAYNTTENAADLADLRTALGIGRWNVYGVSYGTDLALQLLRDHPRGIRSLVLDSLLPPQVNFVNGSWPNAASGYRALFEACSAQPACATAYPDLAGEFTRTVARLARQPLIAEAPDTAGGPVRRVVIDGYTLANLVVQESLRPGTYAGLPALIHSAAQGDGGPAARELVNSLSPPGIVGYGLTFGVFCREHVPYTDPATELAKAEQALPGFPDEVLALVPQSPRIFDDCGIWDVGKAPASVRHPVRSAVPVLLLDGTFDAVTPPGWAKIAARGLSSSRLLLFPGIGHDVVSASDCARSIMVDFLQRPRGGYDTSCLSQVTVPQFTTGPTS